MENIIVSKFISYLRKSVAVSCLALTSSIVLATGAQSSETDAEKYVGYSLSGTYLAARIATIDKNTEAAVEYYRQAMKFDPENEFLKQNAFLTLVSNGNFEESVKLGKQIQELESSPPLVSVVLGVDFIRTKAWTSAIKQLSEPTRGDLERLLTGLLKAWSQQGAGDTKEALKTIDALEGPSWFKIFSEYHGGLIAGIGGDANDAIARLNKTVKNRAGGSTAVHTYMRSVEALARAQLRSGAEKDASETINMGLKIQPSGPALMRLNKSVGEGGTTRPLISSAQQGAAEVFYNLGAVLNSEGGKQFALIYLQLANVLNPASDVGTLALADLYDSQSLPERANKLFAKVSEDSPYRRIAKLEMALNLDELKKLDEAKKEMEELIKSDPSDLVASLSYGQMLVRHEKFADAVKVYKAAIENVSNPKRFHWNLFYRHGIASERSKNWPVAEKSFLKALELSPEQPNVLNYLGYSWVDMNINLDDGLNMIRKAVELRPQDGYIIDSLGWAYYRLGRYEEAVSELERAIEKKADDPTINDHLGDAYWRIGRRLEATFQWSHAVDLKPVDSELVKINNKLKNGLPEIDKTRIATPPKKSDSTKKDQPEKKS
jgi:tetratricopeptide (TPR) repeat protein